MFQTHLSSVRHAVSGYESTILRNRKVVDIHRLELEAIVNS